MTQFRADLHIHSRYSRATSKKLTPYNLAAWARVKGLDVLGTGDFTHSGWRNELREALVFDEASGLYQLREPKAADAELPEYGPYPKANATRFILQGEISSIYKRGGSVRKVHNLVFMPDFETAERFCSRLAQAGNLESDGRPILGLDSRNLLEMVLEADPRAFLIPAHIWTPWFSLFGSKSGFNSVEECYRDLSGEIFAMETGLSSDPEMNRLWSGLDAYKLVSNSDAHSGENLGREANLFSGAISYDGMFLALKSPEGCAPTETLFEGTLEFFPEEGKYHLDGHRKCDVVLDPHATRELGGICPVCHKPLTVGVLYRVLELADREVPVYRKDESFTSLIPLSELLSEIIDSGAKSKKVIDQYGRVIARFGSELDILQNVSVEDLVRYLPPLGEAVARMRKGKVVREGGYDGEYGTVRVFSTQERREFSKGRTLAGFTPAVGLTLDGREEPETRRRRARKAKAEAVQPSVTAKAGNAPEPSAFSKAGEGISSGKTADESLGAEALLQSNEAQKQAVAAGPGTGKTRTLVERVLHLMEKGVSPRHIVAVTFTRRAAAEMDSRLAAAIAAKMGQGEPILPRTDTLHALAFELWHRTHDEAPILLSEEAARRVFAEANGEKNAGTLRDAWERISLARERCEKIDESLASMYVRYSRQKGGWNLADYTDLLEFWLEQIQSGLYTMQWKEFLVDEIQDLSALQLTLIKALMPANGNGFFGIGDPDQSIYGFRGAYGKAREYVQNTWPDVTVIALRENYRSAPAILHASSALLGSRSVCGELVAAPDREYDGGTRIHLFEAPTAEAEASWIAAQVRALIGGSSLTLLGQVRETGLELPQTGSYSPSDIAILVRMRSLAPLFQKALTRVGLIAAVPEDEGFWMEPRVALIIREAGRMLGIAGDLEAESLPCPAMILARGPAGIAAYFADLPPFDALFWQSAAFKALDRAFREYGGWTGLINWVNLQTELELVRSRSERIQIMSLHAAKGLEFQAVFLPALEDGLVPFAGPGTLSGNASRDAATVDMEEERRLLYVGMTRARECLFLSLAAKRRLYGKDLRLKPSRFLTDIPTDGIAHSALVAKQKREEKQLPLL